MTMRAMKALAEARETQLLRTTTISGRSEAGAIPMFDTTQCSAISTSSLRFGETLPGHGWDHE